MAACRELIRNNPGRGFYQSACLRELVKLLGQDAAPDIDAALKSDDPILREAAEKLR